MRSIVAVETVAAAVLMQKLILALAALLVDVEKVSSETFLVLEFYIVSTEIMMLKAVITTSDNLNIL